MVVKRTIDGCIIMRNAKISTAYIMEPDDPECTHGVTHMHLAHTVWVTVK